MRLLFSHLTRAVAHPLRTGSVIPSSARLCDVIIRTATLADADTVVELGSGTGVFTERILAALPLSASLAVIEIDPHFATQTSQRCPEAKVFNTSAINTQDCLAQLGKQKCDRVVSSLPMASFNSGLQQELLDVVKDVLEPGGFFVCYAYVPIHKTSKGKNFQERLYAMFEQVEKTKIIWRNFPPAFVYIASK